MKKNDSEKSFLWLSRRCMVLIYSMILLFVLTDLFPLEAYAQQRLKVFSLKLEQSSVLDALLEINRLSGNEVVFRKEEVEFEKRRVTLDLKDVSTLQAVRACLENTGLTCIEKEGKVVVMRKNSVTITGKVTDEKGVPLPGATVLIKGDSITVGGTSTDVNGNYEIMVPVSVQTLSFSFIGYKSQEIAINGRDRIDVKLEEEAEEVGEVVVNGVFTRKAESFTGSSRTFTGKDLQRVGNTNVFQSLKNLDPSLRIADNMVMGSDPNTLPTMKLRGTSSFPNQTTNSLRSNFVDDPNQPLFIVDGFETSTEKVFDMDMNRIQSITVLKDAAAKALYGSKAANGVIVIETKRLLGDATQVTYTGNIRLEMPDLTSYDLCNAREKLYVESVEGYYGNRSMESNVLYQQLYNERLKATQEGLDTYWLAKPLHTGVGHSHTIEVEMGEKNLKSYATFSYNDVRGAMKGSSRNTISGELNLSYRHQNILFRNIMSISSVKGENSPYGSFDTYAKMNPYLNPYDEEGRLVKVLTRNPLEGTVTNPLYDAQLDVVSTDNYLEFSNNFYVEVDFLKNMKAVASIGVSSKRTDAEDFYPSDHSKFIDYTTDEDKLRAGSYNAMNGQENSLSGNFRLQWSKSYNEKHNLFLTAQYGLSEKKYSEVTNYTEGFPTDRMNNIIYARQYAKDAIPTGSSSINRTMAFLGVFSYNYDNRFLSDFTFQTDASSSFGKNNRWGNFWSVGIGWNIHHEKFFENVPWVQELKLRGSIGYTGKPISESNPNATYTYSTDRYYQGFAGAMLNNMENPDLSWQQKMDYTVGLDMRIKGLALKFDYYIADSKNMTFTRSIVTSTGFETVPDNLGKVRNQGIELSLTYTLWQGAQGFFNVFGAITTNNNKILKISDELRAYNERQKKYASYLDRSTPVALYEDGRAMNTIWAVRSLGIDPANGEEVFLDRNGNKTTVWNADDLEPFGSTDEKYNGNFGFNGDYKGIGLSVTFTYLGGGNYYNTTLIDKVENADMTKNVDRRVFSGRWQYPGQNAQFRRLGRMSAGDTGTADALQGINVIESTRLTSRFVQKRNELTLSQVSAYYEFNRDFVKKIGLQRLKFSAYMNNIATFSTIKIERGTSFPFARTLSLSLSGTF